MSTIITTTSGISYSNSAGASGPYFPLKYALPVYDPYLDSYLLSATLYPASACEPISAVWPRGEVIYNTTSLSATFLYTVTNTKMLVSAAGQAGTSTITGNPFNAVGYVNLLNGKPLSPTVSGTSMNYSNGSWLVGGYASIPVSGTLNTVSGYSNVRDIYFPVVSYTPLTCAAGGQARGLHKVRIGNQYGSFKFNKVAIFMTKYNSGGVEDTTQSPVLYAIVALPNSVIKTNTGENISYIEVDVETTISASNYFGQVSYLTNSEWNTASPGVINYTGKAALGSSAIPGSWEPRSRLHLYSESSVDHLRFSNESFDYLSFDLESDGSKAYYTIDTSASKIVDMRVRGNISASNNVTVGGSINVSGDFFNPRVSIQADGVISTDGIVYTEYLEVYNTASFDNVVQFYNDLYVNNTLTSLPSVKITSAGTISAGGTDGAVYSRYLYASDYAAFNTYAYAKTLDVGKMSTFNDKMMFINGQTGLVSVQITSGGVVSAGSDLLGYGLNVVTNGYFGGGLNVAGSAQINNNVTFLRDFFTQGNHYIEDGRTGAYSSILTSAGTISAGGEDGAIYSRYLYGTEYAQFGSTYITEDITIERDINLDGIQYFHHGQTGDVTLLLTSGGMLSAGGPIGAIYSRTMNTSAALRSSGGVFLDGDGLYARTVIVAATGSAPNLTAACGSAICGKVTFSSTLATRIIVQTTAVQTNSIIFVTGLNDDYSQGSYIVRSDLISNGVSFGVNYDGAAIDYSNGFNFFIVNPA
jgi:hypothetical protein